MAESQLFAAYDYAALDDEELSLVKGAPITVTATPEERREDRWWDAVDRDGRTGLVAENYLAVWRARARIRACVQTRPAHSRYGAGVRTRIRALVPRLASCTPPSPSIGSWTAFTDPCYDSSTI